MNRSRHRRRRFLFLSPAAFQLFSSANIDFSAAGGAAAGGANSNIGVRGVRVRASTNGEARLCGGGPPRASMPRPRPCAFHCPSRPTRAICIPRTPHPMSLDQIKPAARSDSRIRPARVPTVILCVQRALHTNPGAARWVCRVISPLQSAFCHSETRFGVVGSSYFIDWIMCLLKAPWTATRFFTSLTVLRFFPNVRIILRLCNRNAAWSSELHNFKKKLRIETMTEWSFKWIMNLILALSQYKNKKNIFVSFSMHVKQFIF